ncbi:MAG: hypothetical protein U0003_05355 [Vampirovibrionales bacterium]
MAVKPVFSVAAWVPSSVSQQRQQPPVLTASLAELGGGCALFNSVRFNSVQFSANRSSSTPSSSQQIGYSPEYLAKVEAFLNRLTVVGPEPSKDSTVVMVNLADGNNRYRLEQYTRGKKITLNLVPDVGNEYGDEESYIHFLEAIAPKSTKKATKPCNDLAIGDSASKTMLEYGRMISLWNDTNNIHAGLSSKKNPHHNPTFMQSVFTKLSGFVKA